MVNKKIYIILGVFFVASIGFITYWISRDHQSVEQAHKSKDYLSSVEDIRSSKVAKPSESDVQLQRSPTSNANSAGYGIKELNQSSEKKWKVEKNPINKKVTRLAESRLSLSLPPARGALEFLDKYAYGIWGVDSSSFSQTLVDRDANLTVYAYEQVLNGFPVYNSQMKLFIDSMGGLVYVVANIYSPEGRAIQSSVPEVNDEAVSELVHSHIESYFTAKGQLDGALPDREKIASWARPGYWGEENGKINFIYLYEMPLADYGYEDLRVRVDPIQGVVLSIEKVSIK